jgi:hypothetical protein
VGIVDNKPVYVDGVASPIKLLERFRAKGIAKRAAKWENK